MVREDSAAGEGAPSEDGDAAPEGETHPPETDAPAREDEDIPVEV